MTKVHVLTGLPASGKTSHARTLDAVRFNLDDLRAMMGITPETWTREREDVALRAMLDGMKTAINAGYSVVADNTHLVPRIPKMYRKELGPLGVEFVVHDFTDVPVDECIRRDQARTNGVGQAVIEKMHRRLERSRSEGWRLTPQWLTPTRAPAPDQYVVDLALPPAVIVDIDGTVAIHGAERGHYEYEKVSGDSPNYPVISLVQELTAAYEVIFLSGREDRCREDTEAWLDKHIGISYSGLYMRTTNDHRPDYIIKAELFDAHVRHKYNVRLVLDDRDQVVKMWRSIGLTCLQVADGNF